MRHRYPFDALHWLRQRRVDRQAAAVSESALHTAQARREEAHAAAVRENTEHGMAELSETERLRLGDGLVRAGELQVLGDWRKGAEARLERALDRERAARETRVAQVTAETEARRELGNVSNAAKVIDSHRSDWHAERDAARERSDEEAASEQWNASHYLARRG